MERRKENYKKNRKRKEERNCDHLRDERGERK